MSTGFEVLIVGQEAEYARQAAGAVFARIDRLEGMLSRFDACSDVGQINGLAPGERVAVSCETMECLLAALALHAETHGAFDFTVGCLAEYWRAKGGGEASPDREALAAARAAMGVERLDLDAKSFTVGVKADDPSLPGKAAGVAVDMGGIGKGFALDTIKEILDDWQIDNALVHGGTSTAVARGGGASGKGWRVGVGGPWGVAAGVEAIELRDEALSGSGTEVKGEHIVNPISGRPERRHLAAWARCPSATRADALSTAFMVMSTEAVRRYCAGRADVEAFVVPAADNRLIRIGPGKSRNQN